MYTPSDAPPLALQGGRRHDVLLFFCRDSALCSDSVAPETMGTIPKNLRARLTQVARTMEGCLSGYLVAIQ